MKSKRGSIIFFGVLIPLTMLVAPAAVAKDTPTVTGDYRIGCGDILWISVWQNEKLDKEIVVLPDGKITFPLVGEVVAAGKTLSGLKQELIPLFMRYINEPEITVSIRATNSMFIYVLGKVNNPGRHALIGKVDMLQALAIAGGLNAFADEGNVSIFRRENGATTIRHFSYRDVVKGRRIEENILLERGDVIVVP